MKKLILIVIILITSCKKENIEPISSTGDYDWYSGKYMVVPDSNSSDTIFDMSLIVDSDSILWTLSSDQSWVDTLRYKVDVINSDSIYNNPTYWESGNNRGNHFISITRQPLEIHLINNQEIFVNGVWIINQNDTQFTKYKLVEIN